jgi:hypothetical protein
MQIGEDAMAHVDRPGLIELLGRLGAVSDEAALAAARDLHRKVSESGSTWDELLRADFDTEGARADTQHDDEPLDEAAADETPAEPDGELSGTDKAEAARLIDRLLARKNLSSTLRDDLTELKRSLAEGGFDAMDSRYIRALAKRLGA